MSKQKRVGIMGGTFDPIHIGHLILAEHAYEQFGLDQVLFLPNGNPPHKPVRPDGASELDRLEMVRLAVRDNPRFAVDPEEIEQEGYHYSKDTLRNLKELHPDTEYYFIIGGDSLMTFHQWRDPEEICRYCTLTAAVRDGLDTTEMEKQMQLLRELYHAKVELLSTPELDISSSSLRKMCEAGKSIRYFVPDAVRAYIEEHRLYQRVSENSEHK